MKFGYQKRMWQTVKYYYYTTTTTTTTTATTRRLPIKNYLDIFTVTSLLNEKRLPIKIRIITTDALKTRWSKCRLKYEFSKSAESAKSAESVEYAQSAQPDESVETIEKLTISMKLEKVRIFVLQFDLEYSRLN